MNKDSKIITKIWCIVLAVLTVGCFIFGIVSIKHNNDLHSFKNVKDKYSASDIKFSPKLSEVVQSEGVTIYAKDFQSFVDDFHNNTGIPILLNFTTVDDLNLNIESLKSDEDFVKYCEEHYKDFTDNAQDYLCITVCFADLSNVFVSFVPGDLVVINYDAVGKFYDTYNKLAATNNYKYSNDIMVKSLDAFKSATFEYMTSKIENGQYVGVYKDASDFTQDQLDGVYGKFIRYNEDDKADKVLTIDHQIYYEYSNKLVPKPLIVVIFVLGFVFCVASILLTIKFYGEYGSKE